MGLSQRENHWPAGPSAPIRRTGIPRSGYDPVAVGDHLHGAVFLGKAGDVAPLGSELLPVAEREMGVIAGHQAVLDDALQLLDQVRTHVAVREVLADLCHQVASEESIDLHL